MKIASHFFVVILLIASESLKEAKANECKEFVKKLMLDQMKFIVPCLNKLGLTSPEQKRENVFCIIKCVLIDAKMLGADGGVDFDLVNGMIETLPVSMKDKANTIFTECGHHAASLNPGEASCKSYEPLLSCLTDISVTLCGSA